MARDGERHKELQGETKILVDFWLETRQERKEWSDIFSVKRKPGLPGVLLIFQKFQLHVLILPLIFLMLKGQCLTDGLETYILLSILVWQQS